MVREYLNYGEFNHDNRQKLEHQCFWAYQGKEKKNISYLEWQESNTP